VHPGPQVFFLVELSVRLRKNPGSQADTGVFLYSSGKGKSPCSLTYWEMKLEGTAVTWSGELVLKTRDSGLFRSGVDYSAFL
jgi:hypothetical protein